MSVITPCCTRAVVSLGRSVARDSGVSLLFVFFKKKNGEGASCWTNTMKRKTKKRVISSR